MLRRVMWRVARQGLARCWNSWAGLHREHQWRVWQSQRVLKRVAGRSLACSFDGLLVHVDAHRCARAALSRLTDHWKGLGGLVLWRWQCHLRHLSLQQHRYDVASRLLRRALHRLVAACAP